MTDIYHQPAPGPTQVKPTQYVVQHGATNGIPGNFTAFLERDAYVTENSMPPESASYEMPHA